MLALLLAAAVGLSVGALLARVPRGLQRRSAVMLISLTAGIAAAFAKGAATGSSSLDVGLRFALITGLVLLASRTPQPWIIAAGLVTLAGAVASGADHKAVLILAGAGAGMALARVNVEPQGRRTSLAATAAAGLLGNAALRLGRPHPFGTSAVIASTIFMLIILGGTLRLARRRRRRRRIFIVLGLLLFTVLGLGAIAVGTAVLAKPHLEIGIADLQAGLAAARGNRVQEAASDLDAAATAFSRGNRYLHLAAPALGLPVAAQQVRALRALGFSGQRLAATGATTLTASDLSKIRLENGVVPLQAVNGLAGPLERALATLIDAEDRLTKASSKWLIPPVQKRLMTVTSRVNRARREGQLVLEAVRVVPHLAGSDGARHYFLAVQTPAELRSTGGIIGNYGQIDATAGQLRLSRRGRSSDLNAGLAASGLAPSTSADYGARYGRFAPQLEWRNVTLSPDFPTVAHLIEQLYPSSGGQPVDGVVSIDPIGLSALLRVLGPVQVPTPGGPTVTLTAEGAQNELLHGQYEQFSNPDRIDFLNLATQAIWNRLTTGALPSMPDVVQSLASVLRGKHLMLASTHPDEQRFFHDIGADGAIAPVDGDYLGVVTQNASGNKIDWFLHRSIDYGVTINPTNGVVTARVQISLRNDAPSSGEPPIVIDSSGVATTKPGENELYLSAYTPWEMAAATLDGKPVLLESDVEFRRNVFSTFIVVPPGSTSTLDLFLVGRYTGSGAYRLDILHQPTIWPDRISVHASGSAPSRAIDNSFEDVADKTLLDRP